MSEELEPFFSNSIQEVHSDSLKFKVALSERTINRLKDENNRQKQKIIQLQKQITLLSNNKLQLIDSLAQRQSDYTRLNSQKYSLEKKMEIRTLRHVAQQHQYLTISQKESIERRVRESEEEVSQYKSEIQKLMRQSHTLLQQVENERRANDVLEKQLSRLSAQLKQSVLTTQQLQKLYIKKLQFLQTENKQLKYKAEDLILQLKLHERRQEMEVLLSYEDRIGTTSNLRYRNSTHSNLRSNYKLSDEQKGSQLPGADTFREYPCRCLELEEELGDQEEIIQLLKEKNQRLANQLEQSKKRCQNLQDIICGDRNKGAKR